MNRQEKDHELKYLTVRDSQSGPIHWISPPKETLKVFLDRLLRFR